MFNKDIHANPVEIVKKDIYIIKNDINKKVYIGQSLNAEERFKSHCKPSNKDSSIIDMAIYKYGKEHFWVEILESQIKNYNEREKYWIAHYNSITPNGYNIMAGGEEPPRFYDDDHPNCKISNDNLLLLKYDLKHSNLPLQSLALKYGISKKQVVRINQGISRAVINEEYPIRKNPNINGKLSEEDVDVIIDLLRNTYFFNGEIARRFGVKVHAISNINAGFSHKRDNIKYPIRSWKSSGKIPLTYEQVTEIIGLIKENNLSLNKIAKQYNVNISVIQMINNGSAKKYRRDNLQYPIRPF